MTRTRPYRVLAAYDVDGWCQHRAALGIAKFAPDGVTVIPCSHGTYRKFLGRDIDALYHLYFYSVRNRDEGCRVVASVASHAWMYPKLNMQDYRTFGVNPARNSRSAAGIAPIPHGLTTRNRALETFMLQYNKNTRYIPPGVDATLFTPGTPKQEGGKLKVGWCGQLGGPTNFKGHAEIVKPLMESLGSERFEWSINTNNVYSANSFDDMVEWYKTLDVFLSTASADGTPNPPFEAAASGVPVIATDVGALTDWDVLVSLGLVVPEYRNEQTATKTRNEIGVLLERMIDEPKWRQECGQHLRASIEETYCYEKVAPQLLDFILKDI